jgi:four helix bundle protein
LRAGTSIGANIEEAIGGQTKKDFFSKLNIAYKETRETIYWLKLLKATDYLTESQADSMIIDASELEKIIGSIIVTLKKQLGLLE